MIEADPLAIAAEIGAGKRKRNGVWAIHANPALSESLALDQLSEESLIQMENAVLQRLES